MTANLLKKSFDKYFNAPVETWSKFVTLCDIVTFKKEEIIKQSNTREKYFYFILEGSAGIFLWKNTNFICVDFVFENNFFGDYMSLLTEEPSPLQTMTLNYKSIAPSRTKLKKLRS